MRLLNRSNRGASPGLIVNLSLGYNLIGKFIGFSPLKYEIYPRHFLFINFFPSSVINPSLVYSGSFIKGLLSFNNIRFSNKNISVALLNIGVAVKNIILKFVEYNITLYKSLKAVCVSLPFFFLPLSDRLLESSLKL